MTSPLFPAPMPAVEYWPADLRALYHERLAIMQAEGIEDAERKAAADTWERWRD